MPFENLSQSCVVFHEVRGSFENTEGLPKIIEIVRRFLSSFHSSK